MSTPRARFEELRASGAIHSDDRQSAAVGALQNLYEELVRPAGFPFVRKPPQGLYMHGGVGRGKSMLMDMFFDSLPESIKKRRVHFHEFMIETHDWLHKKRGEKAVDNLLPAYAAYVAKGVKVLCFDEFHVTDVADAMILSRLFTALFDKGLVMVATSNWPPERLYEGGLQRERFLPFIALLRARLGVVHLDGDRDYRESVGGEGEYYVFPLGQTAQQKMDALFDSMTGGAAPRAETVTVKGRDIEIMAADGVARCSFAQLCERPHAAEDYLRIADKFRAVFLEGVPRMGYDRRNETKRLMMLIDVLYDRGVRLAVSADAPPEKLYYGSDHAFEFDRTVSRLREMQSPFWPKAGEAG